MGVDFQKIEEAPITDFEREVQERIAVRPVVLERLIREEKIRMVHEGIKQAGLSDPEIECVRLTLEGSRPIEIVRKTGIKNSAVHYYLQRAIEKLSSYVQEHYESNGQTKLGKEMSR